MGKGVNPTKMCQTLVHKVAQSKQQMAVADPEILVLFESWLEELEEEVSLFLRQQRGRPFLSTALGEAARQAGPSDRLSL